MKLNLRMAAIATSTVVCATLLSFGWSEQSGVLLSVTKADAQGARVYIRTGYASNAVYTSKPFLVRRKGLLHGWTLEWCWVQLRRLA